MSESFLDPAACLCTLPHKIRTWVQPSISRQLDEADLWWIRISRKSGSASPPERTILAFWCHDTDFAEFLRLYYKRINRVLSAGISVGVNPDLSIFWDVSASDARTIFQRQIWYGRRMQDLGMTILPNLPLLNLSYAEALYYELLPSGVPLAAQIQTAMRPNLGARDADSARKTAACLEAALHALSPPEILLYGSRSVFNAIARYFSHPEILRFVSNISEVLNGKA